MARNSRTRYWLSWILPTQIGGVVVDFLWWSGQVYLRIILQHESHSAVGVGHLPGRRISKSYLGLGRRLHLGYALRSHTDDGGCFNKPQWLAVSLGEQSGMLCPVEATG